MAKIQIIGDMIYYDGQRVAMILIDKPKSLREDFENQIVTIVSPRSPHIPFTQPKRR